MKIVHLAASPFLGGIERQMLGLASGLPEGTASVFLTFAEGGRCRPFADEARRLGHEAIVLEHNAPRYLRAVREVSWRLRRLKADVLCCHGYKPDLLGWPAARRAGVPIVSVSHGWTAATRKVRINETLDRLALRLMDRVVCVSEGQAVKVRRAGVPADRVVVIRDAVQADRFDHPDPSVRGELEALFADPPARIVGAGGRLSPEKGFAVLIESARTVLRDDPDAGFVVYGDGPLRGDLSRRISEAGLGGRFLLPGFRGDLDRVLPHFDLVVLPSFTEGLPNILLEAQAAGVPVVATAVGGTPEAVDDGRTGHLVPPGDPAALARRIGELLGDPAARRAMGVRARMWVRGRFTFEAQAAHYRRLFDDLSAGQAPGRFERPHPRPKGVTSD